jgi:hypothetical protein
MSSPLKEEIFESVTIIPTKETDLDIFLQNKTDNLEQINEEIEPAPEPAGAEPAVAEPAGAEPAVAEPAGAEPAVAEPAGAESTPAPEPAGAESESEHIKDKIIDVTEKFVHKGIEEVKEKLADIGIKSSTMHLVIKYVIEAVEKFPTTGSARKDLALRIIKDLVGELPDSSEKEFILETLNNGLIADTIDLIISATKGDLAINVVQDVVFTCIPSCINYFRKRREKNKKKKAIKNAVKKAVKKAMMEEE